MRLDEYTYVFAIGTLFAMLDAFNNGASEYSEHYLVC
jgi:sodium-dependent phosphate transporter